MEGWQPNTTSGQKYASGFDAIEAIDQLVALLWPH